MNRSPRGHRNQFACAGSVFFVWSGAAAVVPEGLAGQKRKYGSRTKGVALACEMQLAGSSTWLLFYFGCNYLCNALAVTYNGAVHDCRLFSESTLARERQVLPLMRPTTSRTTSTRLCYLACWIACSRPPPSSRPSSRLCPFPSMHASLCVFESIMVIINKKVTVHLVYFFGCTPTPKHCLQLCKELRRELQKANNRRAAKVELLES